MQNRSIRLILTVLWAIAFVFLCTIAVRAHLRRRALESEILMQETKRLGLQAMLAEQGYGGPNHGTVTNVLGQEIRFEYTPPAPGTTNVVLLLVGRSRAGAVAFYTDGSVVRLQ